MNIILVTVDCLRARNMGCYGYERNTTPEIDELASDGIQFNNCFANAPYTSISFPSLLASVYHAIYDGDRIPESVPLISEVLSDANYNTAGISAANPNLVPQFGYADGFDTFVDFIHSSNIEDSHPPSSDSQIPRHQDTDSNQSDKISKGEKGSPSVRTKIENKIKNGGIIEDYAERMYVILRYRLLEPFRKGRNYMRFIRGYTPNALTNKISPSSGEIVDQAIKWLKSRSNASQPYFLWLHLMDPHSWYDPAQEYVEELFGEDIPRISRFRANRALMSASPFRGNPDLKNVEAHLDTLKRLYDASIRQVDTAIGKIKKEINEMENNRDTTMIITSDHGEQFLEHGGVQHGDYLYNELLHVPLIVTGDGVPSRSIRAPAQLLDIPPTISDLAGKGIPDPYLGDSLNHIIDGENVSGGRVVVSATPGNKKVSVRNSRCSYIEFDDGRTELYDHAVDPLEQNPLTEREVSPDLKNALSDYRMLCESSKLSSRSIAPTEEIRSRLDDLGYM